MWVELTASLDAVGSIDESAVADSNLVVAAVGSMPVVAAVGSMPVVAVVGSNFAAGAAGAAEAAEAAEAD